MPMTNTIVNNSAQMTYAFNFKCLQTVRCLSRRIIKPESELIQFPSEISPREPKESGHCGPNSLKSPRMARRKSTPLDLSWATQQRPCHLSTQQPMMLTKVGHLHQICGSSVRRCWIQLSFASMVDPTLFLQNVSERLRSLITGDVAFAF